VLKEPLRTCAYRYVDSDVLYM